MTYTRPNGQTLSGPPAISALQSDYALPLEFHSDPMRAIVTGQPSSGGYFVWAETTMYANLPGDGKGWEAEMEAAYVVDLVGDEEGPLGLKARLVQDFADPTPLLGWR